MEESEFTLQLSLFAEHNVDISGKELIQAVNRKIQDIKNGFQSIIDSTVVTLHEL